MTSVPNLSRRKQPTSAVSLVSVTPQQATIWLQQNSNNRPIRRFHVQQLVGAIKRNEWRVNGETIKFASDGTLVDGQHRLNAVAKSGQTVEMYVVRDVDPEAVVTIDMGARRTLADVMQSRGASNTKTNRISTAVNFLAIVDGIAPRPNLSSIKQRMDLFERHPQIEDAVDPGARLYRAIGLNEAAGAVAFFKISEAGGLDRAAAFWDPLCSGENLVLGDPRLAVRQFVIRPRVGVRLSTAFKFQQYGALVKAWNAFVNNRELKVIRYGGENALKMEAQAPPLSQ